VLVAILLIGGLWYFGRIDRYIPKQARSTSVLGTHAPAYDDMIAAEAAAAVASAEKAEALAKADAAKKAAAAAAPAPAPAPTPAPAPK
jgi:hypothetical protein